MRKKRSYDFRLLVVWVSVFMAAITVGCSSSESNPGSQHKEEVAIAWSAPHGPRPTTPTDFATICKDRSGSIYVVVSDRDSIAFFMKYDSNGKRIWFTREQFLPAAIFNDLVGHVYVAGSKIDKTSAFSGSVVSKYKDSGEKVWSAASNRYRQGLDKTCSLTVDGWGNVYLTGMEFGGGIPLSRLNTTKTEIRNGAFRTEFSGFKNHISQPRLMAKAMST